MKARILPLFLAAGLVLGCSDSQRMLEPDDPQFILGGEPTHVRHGHVGAFCAVFVEGDPWECFPAAGVLVSKDVVVAVAHAGPFLKATNPARTGFTFDPEPSPESRIHEATTYVAHPDWDPGNIENPMDLGVFILDQPVDEPRPAKLPKRDFLTDRKVENAFFTLVGYGLQTLDGWPGDPDWKRRLTGRGAGDQLHTGSVVVESSDRYPNTPCFGDSSSGLFYRDTNILVGTFSAPLTGDCSRGLYTALDTDEALSWVNSFID